VGQLLSRISHDLFYPRPEPCSKGEFSFIIITGEIKRLAGLLFYFCNSFDWQENEDDCVDFQVAAADVQQMLKDNEEYACPCYVEFINQYLEENGW
jgi:hypothetical protein